MEIIKIVVVPDCKIITCRCRNYDEYNGHPETLRFLGDLYVKTGWNSDENEIYYKTSRTHARSF